METNYLPGTTCSTNTMYILFDIIRKVIIDYMTENTSYIV
jgi:hypothetical protein